MIASDTKPLNTPARPGSLSPGASLRQWLSGVVHPAANRLSHLRSQSRQELVKRVRRARLELALEDWSDFDLRKEMDDLRAAFSGTPDPSDHVDGLVVAFAVVDESIRRRLGFWRLFNGPERPPSFDACFQASQGHQSLDELSSAEKTVAEAMMRVATAGNGRFGPDLMFPAEFYRALAAVDTNGVLRFQPSDEQRLAGLYLLDNRVVEMQAGEGKTVAIAFAAVAHALGGQKVHIITANDYLADRDCRLLAPVYRSLGLTAGAILEAMDGAERRAAYQCDIVYGALRELGFDFLRDRLAARVQDEVQTPLGVAIVDEADQALVDEADTPLIVAGPPAPQCQPWTRVQKAVAELVQEQHRIAGHFLRQLHSLPPNDRAYGRLLCLGLLANPHSKDLQRLARTSPGSFRRGIGELYPDGGDTPDAALVADLLYVVDLHERFVTLTEGGVEFLSSRLGEFCPASNHDGKIAGESDRLTRRAARQLALASQVYQSLRANLLLERDVDYIVSDDAVILLDRNTGRARPDNTYRFGLQQAVEAREGVTVHPEGETVAQISVQDFAGRYQFLAGITGTATAAADEFKRRHSLNTTTVQPSQPSQRVDLPSRVFASEKLKIEAIVEEVSWCRRIGRPVLVGTGSVGYSLEISRALYDAGIDHRVLNAVQSHQEADIVRTAGAPGAVTVATNMAGRGTDIVLDSDLNEEILARWSDFISEAASDQRLPLKIRCGSRAEADLLESALAGSPRFSVWRAETSGAETLVVTNSSNQHAFDVDPCLFQWEFGLGLHVISAEFNRFPRVALQLRGRSGRQGLFGSTRSMLSWEDPALLSLGQRRPALRNCQFRDASGRDCWEGPAVERYIARRQESAEQEAAQRRSVSGDFASLIDAQGSAYYKLRQELLTGPSVLERLPDILSARGSRLVLEHFPNLDTAGYRQNFEGLEKDARQRYGIALGDLYGLSLASLPAEAAARMRQAVDRLERRRGSREFDTLARSLCIETCDELWRNHLAGLHQSVFSSILNGYGHKSAVADYIIHAADLWERFSEDLWDTVCSRLLTLSSTPVEQAAEILVASEKMEKDLLSLVKQNDAAPGRKVHSRPGARFQEL